MQALTVLRVTDPDGRFTQTTRVRDANGAGWTQTTQVPSPTGTGLAEGTKHFNARGELDLESEAHQPGTATYPQVTYSYFDDGLLKSVASPLASTAGAQATTSYAYDGRGNRLTRTAWSKESYGGAYAQVTETCQHDLDDRPTGYIDFVNTPLAPTAQKKNSITYNTYGQVAVVTDATGRTQTLSYRSDGLVSSEVYAQPGQPNVAVNLAYDGRGQRRRMQDPNGTTGSTLYDSWWEYDRLGRVTKQTTPKASDHTASTLQYTYDLSGNQTKMIYPDNTPMLYTHDSLDRMKSVSGYTGTGWLLLAGYAYSDAGKLKTTSLLGGQSRQYTYAANNSGALAKYNQTITDTPADIVTKTEFTRYHDGRVQTECRVTGTSCAGTDFKRTFAYDAAGQLTDVTVANASNGGPNDNRNGYHYDYDARGQLLRRQITPPGGTATEITGAYNANGQLCRYQSGDPASCGTAGAGSTSLSYDDAGRLKGYTYSNGATETLSYDQRGLLSSVQNVNPTCPATCNRTESRMYSGDRQLTRVSQDNPAVGYDFTWDGTRPEAEIVESRVNGTLWTRSNLGRERISLRASSSSGPSWMAYDAYGSVLPTSQIPAPAKYDPFGGESDQNGGPDHFGYRGELTINGMVHLRARDYNPTTARFTTPDPLDGVDGTTTVSSRYHYANNDPFNREDPLGLRPSEASSAGAMYGGPGLCLTFWDCPEEGQGNPQPPKGERYGLCR